MVHNEKKNRKTSVCPKCGWKNPDEAIFCLKCGSKIQKKVEEAPTPLEGLTFLHIAGSLYTILSAVFNPFVRESAIYLPLYLASGILGLFSAYALHQKKGGKWTKILLSSATVALGFAGTFRLFIIGLLLREEIRGIFGPAWIIFLITALKLWQDRHRV